MKPESLIVIVLLVLNLFVTAGMGIANLHRPAPPPDVLMENGIIEANKNLLFLMERASKK
jgi:hypothetical protein